MSMSLKVPTRQANGTTGTTASTKAVILVSLVHHGRRLQANACCRLADLLEEPASDRSPSMSPRLLFPQAFGIVCIALISCCSLSSTWQDIPSSGTAYEL